MNRRYFLTSAGALALPARPAPAAPRPLPEPHFPDRLHQFVWRNWEIANAARMARVAGCRERDILDLGRAMGLPPKPRLTEDQLRRIYITVIRQNWHLLPKEQIVELLDWTAEKLEFALKEDDFLGIKLGPKPECAAVRYAKPGPEAVRRAGEIRRILEREFGAALAAPGEPPFAFIGRLSAPVRPVKREERKAVFNPRFLYPYFSLYGDPLLEPEIDPFPAGYLERLARVGINGVWMQCLLNTLAPSRAFPEFGARWEERLAALDSLTARLSRQGFKLYLYLNEPRAMEPAFYERRPGMKGATFRGHYAMCTSVPEVRQWLSDSLAHVFARVPALGGVFAITMSENLTNCFSRRSEKTCPRCSRRKSWEVVGEVVEAVHGGVRRSSRNAEVIVWDWGWPDDLAANLIPRLPRDARFLSVSEWSQPFNRGGVQGKVNEYSLSVVGPGPRARAHWKLAREAGIATMAKTQFNNTWEIAAFPYVPVPYLVARHCANLAAEGVGGIMASWTLGGYPSPNLEVASEFYWAPETTPDEALDRVARRRYGAKAAPLVVQAWRAFSDAFEQYPYGVHKYVIPTQHGPANLLRPEPTGVPASMILFPQDDLKRWCGIYPPHVVQAQFDALSRRWEEALRLYRKALESLPGAAEDLAIAEACAIHFRSTANQVEFYMLGRRGERARELLRSEIALARRLYTLARRHSVIAYEASNHYFYRPLDLAEKIISCHWLLK